jgi:hypothetical protein
VVETLEAGKTADGTRRPKPLPIPLLPVFVVGRHRGAAGRDREGGAKRPADGDRKGGAETTTDGDHERGSETTTDGNPETETAPHPFTAGVVVGRHRDHRRRATTSAAARPPPTATTSAAARPPRTEPGDRNRSPSLYSGCCRWPAPRPPPTATTTAARKRPAGSDRDGGPETTPRRWAPGVARERGRLTGARGPGGAVPRSRRCFAMRSSTACRRRRERSCRSAARRRS